MCCILSAERLAEQLELAHHGGLRIAQLVEHQSFKLNVSGSIPDTLIKNAKTGSGNALEVA